MNSSVSARQNADLMEAKYAQWCEDPRSVEESWSAFFEGFELGMAQLKARGEAQPAASQPAQASTATCTDTDLVFFGRVVALIYNYRTLGHTQAHINPLEDKPERNPRLNLEQFGLSEADLDREAWNAYFRHGERMKLRDMVALLEATYSGKIGFEFMHIHHTPIRHWVRERIEGHVDRSYGSPERKLNALRWALEAEAFENFLGKRFLGEKRFSNEGGEGAMILLNAILEACPSHGVKEIEMGMSHRGRMCVLANFVRKSLTTVLYEFTPNYEPDQVAGDGDVKYHLGYESIREFPDGKVRVSLAANPSHLEAVNPVVEGKARARQRVLSEMDCCDIDRSKVLPILLHGDAAFAGQGSVAEVLNLSQLPGYRTGGTIHIVINNQVGFTTLPQDSRSAVYSTDVGKVVQAPIFHVNGDDPESVVRVAQLAYEFRQKFHRDVIIDLVCYRRRGHNEGDDPAMTQPLMYDLIEAKRSTRSLYTDALVGRGDITEEEYEKAKLDFQNRLEQAFLETHAAQTGSIPVIDQSGIGEALTAPIPAVSSVATAVDRSVIERIGEAHGNVPDGFTVHPKLQQLLNKRVEMSQNGEIDWGFGELLALGSLLIEGTPVRFAGQDARRGTFAQRHAVFHDRKNGQEWLPLLNLAEDQARFWIYDSFLSEYAALAFEYGYSLQREDALVVWEAQFGDFANGAQSVIDEYIAAAEQKWGQQSSVVMLLPHGYEGQGPDHSSARIERYLQLCAENNMIVARPSTPANYFHLLRRQAYQRPRKPLVVFTPKSMLRLRGAASSVEDFTTGGFQPVIDDPQAEKSQVTRVLLTSGKIYYDLRAALDKQPDPRVAVVRVEQYYPVPAKELTEVLAEYPGAELVWVQDEPENQGAWPFISLALAKHLANDKMSAVTRKASAAPSTGSAKVHAVEQEHLIRKALSFNEG